MQSFPSGQHIYNDRGEEEEGTAASPGTRRQVEHIVCIVNVAVPPSTHCSHPAVICTHSLGFFSVAGSGYIFIYSTSLEAVIYDFNTQGDGCSLCPCGSGSGGVLALSFVVPFVANIQLLDGWLADGLVWYKIPQDFYYPISRVCRKWANPPLRPSNRLLLDWRT